MAQEPVPNLIKKAVQTGALDATRPVPLSVRQDKLEKWLVEPFIVEAAPPYETYERQYRGRKEFLIDVDPKQIQGDRYWALSTSRMVSACQDWVSTLREFHDSSPATSAIRTGPARCNRLLTPDRARVFDVISVAAEAGSFVGPDGLRASAERYKARFQASKAVYGPGLRLTEPQMALTAEINGFGVAQLQVRRYTYSSTFLHAEFGKRRLYDAYVLMLAGPKVFVVVQTFYPPELETEKLLSDLSMVLQALDQRP
jgi:hypothetical protein